MNRMQMELKEIASGGKMLGLCIAVGISTVVSLITALTSANITGGIIVNILGIILCVGLFLVYTKASTGNELDSSSIKLIKIIYNIKYVFLIIATVLVVLGCAMVAALSSSVADYIVEHKEEVYEWIDEHEDVFEASATSSSMSKDEFIEKLKEGIEKKDSIAQIISIFAISLLVIFLIAFIIMIIYYAKMTRLLKGIYINSLGGAQIDTYSSGYISFCLIVSAIFTAFSVVGAIATPLTLISSLASVASLVLTYLIIKEYKDTTFRMAYAQPQAYMPQGYGQGYDQGYNNPNSYNGPQYNNPNDYNVNNQNNQTNDDQNNYIQ